MSKNRNRKIAELKERMSKVSERIRQKIVIINSSPETSNVFWSNLQVSIRQDYEELRTIFADWSVQNMPIEYNRNIRREIKRIKEMKFKPNKTVNYNTFKNARVNTQTLASVLDESVQIFGLSADAGEKQLNRLLRVTQQLNIQEKQVFESLSKGFVEGVEIDGKVVGARTTFGAQKQLQRDLMKKALDDKFITIINKNGDPITYTAEYYAEMVARTQLRQAASLGTINTAQAFGSDLVQVSSHNTITPICIPFEGKIFSISGRDPDFPPLTDIPPYHPNCLHSITVVFREVLEARGIQQYSDFANGRTEIHPTRRSHIPISDRAARLKNAAPTRAERRRAAEILLIAQQQAAAAKVTSKKKSEDFPAFFEQGKQPRKKKGEFRLPRGVL